MRTVLVAVFILFFGFSHAQQNAANSKTALYALNGPETYELNEQMFTFTPELNRIRIKKFENRDEVDFGQLRKTTDDGLYIMTSTLTEEVSFGRFDSLGNFRTLRYDPKADKVVEENYKRKKDQTQVSLKK